MSFLNMMSIRSRVILIFVLSLIMLLIFAAFSFMSMDQLGALTHRLYKHPLRVSNSSLLASMNVIKMHRTMKDATMADTQTELSLAVQEVNALEKQVYTHLDVVKSLILGIEGEHLERETRSLVNQWKPIREEVIALVSSGKTLEARRITKNKGAAHVALLEGKMLDLTSYAQAKADSFMADTRVIQAEKVKYMIAFILAVSLLSALISRFIVRSILSNINHLNATMAEITKSGTLMMAQLHGKNEITEMTRHFNLLVEKLSNQMWIREGINLLNAQLSGNLSLADITNRAIDFMASYTDSCSGGLFIYDADSKACNLMASYALCEGSHFALRFESGIGIIGQVAAAKEPVRLENIRSEEAVTVSGTIRKTPESIFAIPLTHGDSLHGVIELASFGSISDRERDFLLLGADILAAYIHTANQRDEIKALYKEAENTNVELTARTTSLNAANERLKELNEKLTAHSTELKAQANELEAQKSELEAQRIQVEEADRLKSEFLSNMSHELRTPLNSILALSQLLIAQGTGKDAEKEKSYLKVVERNGRQLLLLINDILDLSKIEAGRMDLFVTDFTPLKMLKKAVDTVRPLAEKKGIPVEIHGEIEPQMTSDEDKIYQIVLNFLTNAVKYTESGRIEASIRSTAKDLIVEVKDTGIGIEPYNLGAVFDEFRQVDGSTTRTQGGTGLGLAICKKLARLLGGDVSVRSTFGQGSTFTLNVPLHYIAPEDVKVYSGLPVENQGHLPVVSSNKEMVLVIDDEIETCNILSEYLTASGYQVVTTTSGRTGIERARTLRPFAITLDILMPEMDGWEVLRILKSSPETSNIPVIIVSMSNEKPTGVALGAAGYAVKPIDRNVLIAEIDRVAKRRRVQKILVVDDDPVQREYVESFLFLEGYQAESAVDGKAALAKAAAILPEIIILDLMMPEMDGFSVLEALKANPALKHIPVIILTAKDLSVEEKSRLLKKTRKIIGKSEMDKATLLKEIESALAGVKSKGAIPSTAKPATRILVVEDDEMAALQIRTALEDAGYHVDIAEGGQAAIDTVKIAIPDAVVLDLMMPEVDGFQVLEDIRSTPRTAHVPVLVLTAKALTAGDRSRLSANNVQEYILKGALDRNQLVASIGNLLTPPAPPPTFHTRIRGKKPWFWS